MLTAPTIDAAVVIGGIALMGAMVCWAAIALYRAPDSSPSWRSLVRTPVSGGRKP